MQRLVYEGRDPERLLRDVWEKHGTGVRITEPEEARKGGIFGFFSRVVYRIEVEPLVPAPRGQDAVPNHEAPAQRTAVPANPLSPDPVASATVPSVPPFPPTAIPTTAVPPGLPSMNPDGFAGWVGLEAGQAATLGRLADSTVDVLELGARARVPSFDAVLEGVANSLGEAPGEYRPGHILPRVALGSVLADKGQGPGAAPTRSDDAARSSGILVGGAPPPATTQRNPAPSGPTRQGGPATSARRLATVLDLLQGAGFPEHLLAGMERLAAADFTVEEAFSALPPPPALPAVAGSLIAVVGEGHEARAAARDLAVELGLDPDEVAVAAPWRAARALAPDLFVRTPEEAAALSPGWRRDRVGLVAVNAPLLGCDHEWAKAMLKALRPSITLGQHLATTKPEDIGRWARMIGGLDALVVEQIDSTCTPAAALGAGVPVLRLDGFPATAKRWAQITTDLVATR